MGSWTPVIWSRGLQRVGEETPECHSKNKKNHNFFYTKNFYNWKNQRFQLTNMNQNI